MTQLVSEPAHTEILNLTGRKGLVVGIATRTAMIEAMSETTENPETRQEKAPSSKGHRHIELSIGGMTCAHCPLAVEKALKAIDGVVSAHVNLSRLA